MTEVIIKVHIQSEKNAELLALTVIVSAVVMITSKIYQFQHALIAATLAGMISGYITYKEDIDDNAK